MSVRDRFVEFGKAVARIGGFAFVIPFAALLTAGCTRSNLPAPEFSTSLEVGGGADQTLERDLAPGTYTIETREEQIDLRALIDIDNTHSELEDAVTRHGLLMKVVSLQQPARLRVTLRSADHSGKRGKGLISVRRLSHTNGAAPDAVEAGYRAFASSTALIAEKTVESWTKAADALNLASAHFRSADETNALAQTEYSLGCLQYLLRENWTAGLRAAGDASEAYESSDDELGVQRAAVLRASAELEIASNSSAESQRAEQRALYEAAERRLDRAADYFAKNDFPIDRQYAVQLRGIRFLYVGNYDRAWEYFSAAESLARVNQDPGEIAKSLNNLALVDFRNGRVTRAATEFEKLLPLIEPQQEDLYALVLGNYGTCLIALGDFDRALAMHTEALQVYASRGDDQMRARQLAAIGGVYFRRGDLVRALDTLRAALALQERGGDGRGRSTALRMAGNASAELGQHTVALEFLRKSRSFDASPLLAARTSVLIAGELRALGDFAGAQAELGLALSARDELSQANALMERAQLRLAQDQFQPALEDLRVADRLFLKLDLDFDRIDSNTSLSRVLLATGDLHGATRAADTAVEIASRIRVKSANPEWRARFLSTQYAPYEARIAALLAAARSDDSAALWNTFLAAEDVRARSLADRLNDSRRSAAFVDTADDALRSRLTAQQLRLETRMARSDADHAGTLELQRAIQETRAQIDANWLRQRKAQGVDARSSAFTESLEAVRTALPPDTAVLAYFVGDGATHAWLLTKSTLRHATLDKRSMLQRRVTAIVDAVSGRQGSGTVGHEAARAFVGDLLDGVTERRLLVIPDGPLNGVPFAALSIGGPSSTELIVDRFVVGYAPSLALALQPEKRHGPAPTRVAVVSDPVYAADDRRLMVASAALGEGTFRGPKISAPDGLTRLPYSAVEAHTVARAFPGREVIELSGFDASASRVLALSGAELAILHFATHANAGKDAPEESALYLSSYSADGSPVAQRRLTLEEIARTGLRADLVVLSGCATGDGSELRGEGVLGLTYGFLANDSRSVVASLWPIQDASTARFMDEFYRAYRVSGRAADALRVAQLRMRARTAPAVWSSFVVRANQFP